MKVQVHSMALWVVSGFEPLVERTETTLDISTYLAHDILVGKTCDSSLSEGQVYLKANLSSMARFSGQLAMPSVPPEYPRILGGLPACRILILP